jgi:hypothetical protein
VICSHFRKVYGEDRCEGDRLAWCRLLRLGCVSRRKLINAACTLILEIEIGNYEKNRFSMSKSLVTQ